MFKNSDSLFNYYSKRKITSIKGLPNQYGDGVYSGRFSVTFSDNSIMSFCTYLGKREGIKNYKTVNFNGNYFSYNNMNNKLYNRIANY